MIVADFRITTKTPNALVNSKKNITFAPVNIKRIWNTYREMSLTQVSNSFSITQNTDMSVFILAFLKPEYLCISKQRNTKIRQNLGLVK